MGFRSAGSIVCAVLIMVASAARAQDATTQRRIEELERRQRETDEELQRLRRQLEQPVAEEKKIDEVERRQGILTDEVRRLREALVLPERRELKSVYGLGPAASKVYAANRGLSIGGYGEANFKAVVADRDGANDEFDFLRFVLYVGYKFNDWIVFNSETEFEHATTGSSVSSGDGSVSVEFATLDFLLDPHVNARGGLLLVPMGFINEIHEPAFFHGNVRPQVEQQILPSTWRANGFGLFGELLPGLEYRTYGITSFNAKGYRPENLRDARQSGNRERAEDWSWVARLDYSPVPELRLGGSLYLGDQGQGERYGDPGDPEDPDRPDRRVKAGVFTQIYEAHAQLRTHGVELRALGAITLIDDADILSTDPDLEGTIAKVMLGYYGEIAYDLMPLVWPETTQYLAPWFRYSRIDTQNSVPLGFTPDNTLDRDIYEIGLSYKPISQVVFKLDYRNQHAKGGGSLPDEVRIGGGFVF